MRKHIAAALVLAAVALGHHLISWSGQDASSKLTDLVVYYNLPNGSVIVVKDRNPFLI